MTDSVTKGNKKEDTCTVVNQDPSYKKTRSDMGTLNNTKDFKNERWWERKARGTVMQ